jgi:hypothetical protein
MRISLPSKLSTSLALIPLVAFLCQDTLSASAREYKEQCRNVTRSVLSPTGNTHTETSRVNSEDPDGGRLETRTVNETKLVDRTSNECMGESTIGAVVGFSNGNTTYGVSYKNRANQFASGRITYLFKDDINKGEAAAALTREIALGPKVDLFLGLGYDYNIQKQAGYTFATTGIDYQLIDRVELNATVRVPLGGSGNNINYLLGLGFNF